MLGAGLSNTTTFVSTTVKTVATDYVMDGEAHFNITLDKDAKVETPVKPRHDAPAPGRPDDKPRPAQNDPGITIPDPVK
jgi:hypothetical protein